MYYNVFRHIGPVRFYSLKELLKKRVTDRYYFSPPTHMSRLYARVIIIILFPSLTIRLRVAHGRDTER